MRFPIILLACACASCSSNAVQHETRSLLCLGFCTEQRVEHTSGEPPLPKEKVRGEANNQTP